VLFLFEREDVCNFGDCFLSLVGVVGVVGGSGDEGDCPSFLVVACQLLFP